MNTQTSSSGGRMRCATTDEFSCFFYRSLSCGFSTFLTQIEVMTRHFRPLPYAGLACFFFQSLCCFELKQFERKASNLVVP